MDSAYGLLWEIPWHLPRFTEIPQGVMGTERDLVTVRQARRIGPPDGAISVGPLRWVTPDETTWLAVPGAGMFRIRRGQVDFDPVDTCDGALRDLALAGPVANLVLRAAGAIPAHGAAVAWRGQVALILGPAAIGTSTLAAALSARGFDLIGDDLLALRHENSSVTVTSGGPLLQVPADVVSALGSRLPTQVTPCRPGATLARRDVRFPLAPPPHHLAAIYVLDNDAKDEPRIADIRGLHRIEAVLQADVHRSVRHVLGRYSDDFGAVGVLTASLPIRKVSRLDAGSLRVGHLSKLVASDFKRVVRSGGQET